MAFIHISNPKDIPDNEVKWLESMYETFHLKKSEFSNSLI